MLDALGLEPLEQSIYELLVDGAEGTLAELQARTNTGPQRIRRALGVLESRGLVYRSADPVPRFAPLEPDIAVDVLILQQEERLKRVRQYLVQLTQRFQRAEPSRNAANLVELVTGSESILRRSLQIQNSARHQVRAIDRAPYTRLPGDLPNHAEEAQLARGVRYRVLYDTKGLAERHHLQDDIARGIARGEEARVLPHAPIKLLIADDRIGMLPLQAEQSTTVSLIVFHQSGLLDAVGALFETLWEQSLPLNLSTDDEVPPDAREPSPEERRTVAALMTGIPDDVAAKQLGISLRTYHRRVHHLMRRLGCETRFQAGARATILGWCRPDSAPAPTTTGPSPDP